MFISVDLPEPLEPQMATNSPCVNLERHAVEGPHFSGARVVDLRDIAEFDDDAHRSSAAGTMLGLDGKPEETDTENK